MANAIVKDVADQSNEFFDQLQSQQQTMFGENQTALDTLSKAWAPVLATGTVPYGYSAGLDSMLQANVLQTTSQATSNAENAEALQQKQQSGGANVAPTGANAAVNAEILAKGQQAQGTGLQQEKIAGYEQGLKNLEGGTQAENDILNATDPSKAANAVVNAGNMAEKAGVDEWTENQATGSPMAIMKDIGAGVGLATQIAGAGAGFAGMGGGGGDASMLDDAQATNAQMTDQISPTEAPMATSLGPPQFHKGGRVPGRTGKEVHAKVLAGETILPIPKNKKQKTLFNRVLANA
jgi:hypothetical protein